MIKRVQTGGAQLSGHAPLSGFNKPDDSSAHENCHPASDRMYESTCALPEGTNTLQQHTH